MLFRSRQEVWLCLRADDWLVRAGGGDVTAAPEEGWDRDGHRWNQGDPGLHSPTSRTGAAAEHSPPARAHMVGPTPSPEGPGGRGASLLWKGLALTDIHHIQDETVTVLSKGK